MQPALAILFRWLHVATACIAVGGLFFMRVVVPSGLKDLEPDTRHATFLRLRRLFKMVFHACILLLLASGIYNTAGNWGAYNQIPAQAHPLWGIHVLLAFLIFTIALYVLAGRQPPQKHARWMVINLILMAAAIAAAGALKYVREHRPPPAPSAHLE